MRRYQITVGEKTFEVEIVAVRGDQARVLVNGRPYEAKFTSALKAPGVTPTPAPPPSRVTAPPAPPPPRATPPIPTLEAAVPARGLGTVVAPMPGIVLEVLVKVGDRVQLGDTVVKLEAMKMENDLRVSSAGQVIEVQVSKGDNVAVGDVLLVVAPD